MLLTPREHSRSQSSHLRGSAHLGIRPLGCRRLDYHQLAAGPSRCPDFSDPWEWSPGERGHEREQ